jgi:hypothetical protein
MVRTTRWDGTNSGDRIEISAGATGVTFGPIARNSIIELSFPFASTEETFPVLPPYTRPNKLSIRLNFRTPTGPYTHYHHTTLTTTLPLSVGVTDTFKSQASLPPLSVSPDNSLLSIFAVHCTSSPLRILNVHLQSLGGLNVWTPSASKRDLVCVVDRPARFLYQISRTEEGEKGEHPLRFTIGYRLVLMGLSVGDMWVM